MSRSPGAALFRNLACLKLMSDGNKIYVIALYPGVTSRPRAWWLLSLQSINRVRRGDARERTCFVLGGKQKHQASKIASDSSKPTAPLDSGEVFV